MKKLIKIKDLEKKLKEELTKDLEEIIEFDYRDKINNQTVVIKDKRKIKVLLMQLDLDERKQRDEIQREECSYNAKTDDVYAVDDKTPEQLLEEKYFDDEYFRLTKESKVFVKMKDDMQLLLSQNQEREENLKKIANLFLDNFEKLSQVQVISMFLYYFLNIEKYKIGKYLGLTGQRIGQIIAETCAFLSKNH